jgi:hypothetical protein
MENQIKIPKLGFAKIITSNNKVIARIKKQKELLKENSGLTPKEAMQQACEWCKNLNK